MTEAYNLEGDSEENSQAEEAKTVEANLAKPKSVEVKSRDPDALRRIQGSPRDAIWAQRTDVGYKVGGIIVGVAVAAIIITAVVGDNLCVIASFFLIAGGGIAAVNDYGRKWWNRGAHLDCPYCGRKISSSQAWVCGKCGTTNEPQLFQTLFEQCGKCSDVPGSYVCHNPGCGEIILLTNDMDDEHPAHAAGTTAPPPRIRNRDNELKDEWQLQREELEHQVAMVTLGTTLITKNVEAEKAKRELEKVKNPPLPVDQAKVEIDRMLKALATQDEKQKALRKYASDQEKQIKAAGLPPEQEKQELDELTENVGQARNKFIVGGSRS